MIVTSRKHPSPPSKKVCTWFSLPQAKLQAIPPTEAVLLVAQTSSGKRLRTQAMVINAGEINRRLAIYSRPDARGRLHVYLQSRNGRVVDVRGLAKGAEPKGERDYTAYWHR